MFCGGIFCMWLWWKSCTLLAPQLGDRKNLCLIDNMETHFSLLINLQRLLNRGWWIFLSSFCHLCFWSCTDLYFLFLQDGFDRQVLLSHIEMAKILSLFILYFGLTDTIMSKFHLVWILDLQLLEISLAFEQFSSQGLIECMIPGSISWNYSYNFIDLVHQVVGPFWHWILSYQLYHWLSSQVQ